MVWWLFSHTVGDAYRLMDILQPYDSTNPEHASALQTGKGTLQVSLYSHACVNADLLALVYDRQ